MKVLKKTYYVNDVSHVENLFELHSLLRPFAEIMTSEEGSLSDGVRNLETTGEQG